MRSLLREQLRLALGVLTVLGLTIGLLPLAFYLAPGLSDVHLLGMPLGWLLLGVVVYPVLVALGWVYVRRAERNERDFAEIVSETERVNPGLDAAPGIIAISLVTIATLAIGTWGLRFSRTTSDFFVASRSVHPRLNASAIGGEYLSAASFLGVAGLVLLNGADMLWYPVGWTAGYLVLLVLVAAPLRRSGAYTLPDFAEARLGSRGVRAVCSVLVVAIGWLYLLPQFQGAGLTLRSAVGAPTWVGPVIVGVVVLANVTSGGMRSITFVQAFQYWLKLTALLVPAAVLLVVWAGDSSPRPSGAGGWSVPLASGGASGLYVTYSLIIATFLGTMGLPHVVVRFYTNPDGRAARRTTLVVLVLLGALLPAAADLRRPRPDLRAGARGVGPRGRAGAGAAADHGRRHARRGADRDGDRGRLRGLPVDVVGAVDRRRGGAEPGRHRPVPVGRGRGVPARRGRGGDGAVRRRAAGAQPRRRPRGRAGLRDGGRDLLPAAAAGDLVAAASRRTAPSRGWSSAG